MSETLAGAHWAYSESRDQIKDLWIPFMNRHVNLDSTMPGRGVLADAGTDVAQNKQMLEMMALIVPILHGLAETSFQSLHTSHDPRDTSSATSLSSHIYLLSRCSKHLDLMQTYSLPLQLRNYGSAFDGEQSSSGSNCNKSYSHDRTITKDPHFP